MTLLEMIYYSLKIEKESISTAFSAIFHQNIDGKKS
jgi:hypothetical protein